LSNLVKVESPINLQFSLKLDSLAQIFAQGGLQLKFAFRIRP